ncbi:hypothetical protein GRF29_8g3487253 [Pseudopithomyces chartarum]|uniref:Uncharacterized protein n=1 Tax=Pseudopithomyces chartarum TaxID=1892770 RepID=A0AAN6M4Z9_9PLEO|nr:hypothetical protein GRF29_8g3487253 [Pseudopithomyces chartarum]
MPNYWIPGQERFKPSWRPGLPMRGPTLLTMPGEIRNQIYDTLVSDWDGGVLHFPAGVRGRERGGEVSGPRGTPKHFPIYRAKAPLDKMEEFFDETVFSEMKISSVFFWTTRSDNKPVDYMGETGYLLDISFTTYVKHGLKLNYIVSDEIGTMWQARGFKETESQFPEIACLNTSNALFKSAP